MLNILNPLFSSVTGTPVAALLLGTLFVAYLANKRAWYRRSQGIPLPPGPTPWPIVGNLFDIPSGKLPWIVYSEWSAVYGMSRLLQLLNSAKNFSHVLLQEILYFFEVSKHR